MLKLGLIINPVAGLGGSVALKGSDGAETVREALARGAEPRAQARCRRALAPLQKRAGDLKIYTCAGAMGGDLAQSMGFAVELVAEVGDTTCAADTERVAHLLSGLGVDLLLFVGGDGTARNIFATVNPAQACLGVPSGVKMHSGVYAISPEAAGRLLLMLVEGEALPLLEQEVRDIDEEAFRAGSVRAKYYGELQVPEAERLVQRVKHSGRPPEPLQQADIAASLLENMDDDTLYIFGPGSTTLAVLQEMGLEGSLLGVDLVCAGQLLAADVGSAEIEQALADHRGPAKIVVTAIGGQGHIFGRGNQQISPAVIRRVGREGIALIATASKLEELEGRPFFVDTNDALLDAELSGYYSVTVGYRERVLYPVGDLAEEV